MNPKLALGLGILFLLIVSNAVVGYKAYNLGADSVRSDWNADIAARATAQEEANKAILKNRKEVKHANQNRDHDALVRNGCKRGWVRDFENCPADSR